jgi:hypothetical protein
VLFAKGGRVTRLEAKPIGSIAAHPRKKRKDGAPTFRYGKGRTERGEGWATRPFKYDPSRRRIYKSSNSGTRIYLDDNPTLIEEADQSGNAIAH